MNFISSHFGEILALSTAVVWGFAVILFKKSGESVHPVALNLFKNTLALVFVIPTIIIIGKNPLNPAPVHEYIFILMSGALGIGISDTLFFMSLNRLGAGLSAVVDCLYSPSIIGLSMIWLGDVLSVVQIVGAVMIISAVLTASRIKAGNDLDRKRIVSGFIYGALAMLTMAVSIVAIKPLLDRSPLFWFMEVRLAGGILGLLPIFMFFPSRKRIFNSLIQKTNWKYTFSGSFIGTYLALVLWLAGMKFTQTSTAAALNQTSNIFVFIFAAVFLKEVMDSKKVIAIILGVAGTILVTLG